MVDHQARTFVEYMLKSNRCVVFGEAFFMPDSQTVDQYLRNYKLKLHLFNYVDVNRVAMPFGPAYLNALREQISIKAKGDHRLPVMFLDGIFIGNKDKLVEMAHNNNQLYYLLKNNNMVD